jgi:AcrR family transcriptional regulator
MTATTLETKERSAPRRRLPREQRRELMLEAAERFFGERGYHAASMSEIASASGITKPMLYEHFESKEHLYEQCVERARARMFEEIEAKVAVAESPLQKLELFVGTYFDILWRSRRHWGTLYGEASPIAVVAMRERNAEVIAAMLTDVVPEPQVELLAHALVGAGEQAGRWWLAGAEIGRDDLVERFVELCRGMIFAASGRLR